MSYTKAIVILLVVGALGAGAWFVYGRSKGPRMIVVSSSAPGGLSRRAWSTSSGTASRSCFTLAR